MAQSGKISDRGLPNHENVLFGGPVCQVSSDDISSTIFEEENCRSNSRLPSENSTNEGLRQMEGSLAKQNSQDDGLKVAVM
ncbi:hypothetical protein QVD17_10298 [Tagetes erecta]|uniref:Uncharacterized protein n=1 Tax=Tagetes erecta TaxID=13708 RepID=A0AAD8L5H2_TARER|nr:hypothetical protein QVD17_10298 [Tagetes erecta]